MMMATSATNPLRLWPDNPTPLDLLGFEDIAAPVLEAINRERLDPVAVGVFGDWGSGKTTVLEVLNDQLKPRGNTLVVYSRPWEYDPTLDTRATLINEVLEVLRKHAKDDDTLWDKTKDKFAALAKRIKWTKALTLASKSAVTLTLPSPEKLIEIFGDAEKVADPTLQGFRKEFQELMKDFQDVKRVIVLVDDLDRCLPESVVMILEAIKLFLSVQKMAFVIAADEAAVKAAITKYFDGSQQGSRMAGDYLEKIIQIPITVPSLGQEDTEAYLAMMLLDQHLDGDEQVLARIAAHCTERRHRGERQVFLDVPTDLVPDAAQDDLALAAELAPVLFQRLDGNPRRLKRFLNAFWVRSDIAGRRGITLDPRVLAKLMVLERIEEAALGQLLDWLSEGALAHNLRKLEEGETLDAHSAFGWWKDMSPKVAGMDLGPYLRLAASLRRQSGPRSDLRADLADLLDKLSTGAMVDRTQAQTKLSELQEEDRKVMAREIAEALRTNPEAQENLAETLESLLKDTVTAPVIVDGLKRLEASRVDAALAASITGDDDLNAVVGDVVRAWISTGNMQDIAQNAAEEGLRGSS
jgi:GTPase SAR1 family protein